MTGIKRILVAATIVSGIALAIDLYGPPRAAVAAAVFDVLLLTVVLMVFPEPKGPYR